jgi:hypothetical protein
VSDHPAPEKYPLEFRVAVVRELEAIGLGIKDWRDGGVEVEAGDGGEQFLGLANLFRRVSANPPEATDELVRDFFRNLAAGNPAEIAEQMPASIEEAADRLFARVGRPFEETEAAPWSMPVPGAEELAISLVIDYPTMMVYASKEMVGRSATPPGEWVVKGLENLIAHTPERWLQLVHENEGIYCGHAEDSYDAARALVLCELTSSDDLGWLVTVPARDWVFARKVEEAGLPYFFVLKLIARSVVAEQPYPISDEVFWVRPGKAWERFRIDLDGDKVTIYPPAEFAAALNLKMEE